MEDSHDIQLNFMELPLDPTGMKDVVPSRLQTSTLPSNVPSHAVTLSHTFLAEAHSTGSNDELELR